MEFTRNEKKAILQYISAGVSAGANKKEMSKSFMEKLVRVLNISSSNEMEELKSMRNFDNNELFTIFQFNRSMDKIVIFQNLEKELGL